MLHAACSSGADAFARVSSDKAVNPTSVMETSERIAELLVRNQESSTTGCMMVRLGNVLGSRGSVLKTFQDQVEARQPNTVTYPDTSSSLTKRVRKQVSMSISSGRECRNLPETG